MQWLRRLALIPAALALAAGLVLLTVDANRFKTPIEQAFRLTTGRALDLQGGLELQWFPYLGLETGPAEIANAEGFSDAPFARLDHAIVRVAPLALLHGRLDVRTLAVDGLTLNLEVNREGHTNWRDLIPTAADDAEKETGTGPAFSLSGTEIRDAAIHLRDEASDIALSIAPLHVKTGAIVSGQAVDLQLDFDARNARPPVNAHLKLRTRVRIDRGQRLRFDDLKASLTTTGPGQRFRISEGQLSSTLVVDLGACTLSAQPLEGVLFGEDGKGAEMQIAFTARGSADLAAYRYDLDELRASLDATGVAPAERWLSGTLTSALKIDLPARTIRIAPSRLEILGEDNDGAKAEFVLASSAEIDLARQALRAEDLVVTVDASGLPPGEEHLTGELQLSIQGALRRSGIKIDPLRLTLEGEDPDGLETTLDLTATGDIEPSQGGRLAGKITIDLDARSAPLGIEAIEGTLKVGVAVTPGVSVIDISSIDGDLRGRSSSDARTTVGLSGSGQMDLGRRTLRLEDLGMEIRAGALRPGADPISTRVKASLFTDLRAHRATAEPLELFWRDVRVEGTATATAITHAPQVTGHMKINPFSPRQALRDLGYPLPSSAPAHILRSGAGLVTFQVGGNRLVLPRIELAVDDTRLNGKLSVETGDRPALAFLVRLDDLDLDHYLTIAGPGAAAPPGAGAPPEERGDTALGLATRIVRRIDLEGRIEIGRIKAAGVEATEVTTTLAGADGILEARPVRLALYGGALRGALALHATKAAPALSARAELSGIDMAALLRDALDQDTPPLEGTGDLTVDLRSKGDNAVALRRQLEGDIRLEIRRGKLRHDALAANIITVLGLLQGYRPPPAGSRLSFDRLTATWVARQGLLSNDDLRLHLPTLAFRGSGSIDLGSNEIRYALYPILPGKKRDVWLAPLTIEGPIGAPAYGLDVTRYLKSPLK